MIATIAHAVLFIVLSLLILFSLDFASIQNLLIKIVGEEYYFSLHDAIIEARYWVFGNISAFLVIEFVTFVVLPLLSVAIIIKKIREQYKKIKVDKVHFEYLCLQPNFGINPEKDYSYSLNKTYLILGKLLN